MWMIRVFGLAVAVISYWIVNSQWVSLQTDGSYSMRYAVMAPVALVMGFFIFLFPKFIGVPEKPLEKFIVFSVFLIGIAAGVYNLYLMDPSRFGF